MILKGKTLKGKNRIREQGSEWDILTSSPSVLFDARPGPWLFVAPVGKRLGHARWIHALHDDNFEIIG